MARRSGSKHEASSKVLVLGALVAIAKGLAGKAAGLAWTHRAKVRSVFRRGKGTSLGGLGITTTHLVSERRRYRKSRAFAGVGFGGLGGGEVFVAKAVQSNGSIVETWEGSNVPALMDQVDRALGKRYVWEVTIRGESTSDGTHHGKGRGRVLASRDGSTGRWQR